MQRDENNHVSIKCVCGDHRSHRPVARKKADVKKKLFRIIRNYCDSFPHILFFPRT